ncbi:glycosyltransferase family 9 protein [candidate division KSB1 bacterium]|nr:glycosyltransferase family 9 protein [candidate division KSB1 bacterium]
MAPTAVIVNFTRLGDLLQSGPLILALRRRHPERQITLIVLDAFTEVARRLPGVDHVIGFELDRFVGELDSRHGRQATALRLAKQLLDDHSLGAPETLVNLSHTPHSALLCGAMRPQNAYGMVRRDRSGPECADPWLLYTLSVIRERSLNPFHLVDIYRHVFAPQNAPARLSFMVTESDRKCAQELLTSVTRAPATGRFVVMIPGASTPERRWPSTSFAALARKLRASGIASVVVGSRSEADVGSEIERASHGDATAICGRTDLGTLAAILERADCAVGNDTGPLHLATAVGTRVVGLYIGPAAVKDTGPYLGGALALEPDLSYAPCNYRSTCGNCGCAQAITVETVESALLHPELLRSLPGVRVWRTSLSDHHGFRPRLLNRPHTGASQAELEFLRAFWLRLFRVPAPAADLTLLPHDIRRQAGDTARALTEIAACAVTAVARGDSSWSNQLPTLEQSSRLAKPIASYLQVAWSCLPRDDARRYLAAFESFVELMARAVQLLSEVNRPLPVRRGSGVVNA